MSETYLDIFPRDSVVARDGRPFGLNQGRRMKPLDWPLPSTVAGSLRTAIVKASATLEFDEGTKQALKALEIAGLFPRIADELYLPAPNDCVTQNDGEATKVLRARPRPLLKGEGCDLPEGLLPVALDFDQAAEGFKPEKVPAWWPMRKLADWLTLVDQAEPGAGWLDDSFLDRPTKEFRDHVCLDADRGASAEGRIYQSASLRLGSLPRFSNGGTSTSERRADVTLSVRVGASDGRFDHLASLSRWHPLGGERRLVNWRSMEGGDRSWACPKTVRQVLSMNGKRVRMLLVSPAIFSGGWRPGWLDPSSLQGEPPIADAPTLRLVAASVSRWRAVSGWSYESVSIPGSSSNAPTVFRPGPKAIRRMTPAGSVYFFEVVSGDAARLAEQGWLRTVSDDEQECRDGFGLAAWGAW